MSCDDSGKLILRPRPQQSTWLNKIIQNTHLLFYLFCFVGKNVYGIATMYDLITSNFVNLTFDVFQ